jgi:hypothetical protein
MRLQSMLRRRVGIPLAIGTAALVSAFIFSGVVPHAAAPTGSNPS